ncbi:hypothetical protein SKAU_G00333760 [Synaphobranchus kaupii]|uniref:Uncharacterized protein n=1 Tax=Synaphobranchus kaupii TaxID=118154 RepID=A0A9Q1IHU4_SYNKA|nr:hypothetical protein SKAU_G00333760 [Synaphobranchus kaupii]
MLPLFQGGRKNLWQVGEVEEGVGVFVGGVETQKHISGSPNQPMRRLRDTYSGFGGRDEGCFWVVQASVPPPWLGVSGRMDTRLVPPPPPSGERRPQEEKPDLQCSGGAENAEHAVPLAVGSPRSIQFAPCPT